ncbi:type II toxin-antitoxin system VapC family toxin [Candidatus Poribacteria bacterium]|nr:type II toxin-antitoxin system VapC family toxin [Candidatus Poribacteria bacterium]MYG09091.1 type II toxin-antitoxin system VapC family toxin [Candidatus Poribacteria bacterium]MYK20829.1 type II toxin-antitoxin system VapC family toxin [Candidatus Poribacteria bacterium]
MYYFYFDASALAKRYTDEVGSDKIDFFFDNVPLERLSCLAIGAMEVFWICVRKQNDGRITNHQFERAITLLRGEVINTQSDFKTISVPDSLVWGSMDLIETYSLNSVDAMVLRSALDVAAERRNVGDVLVLVASDQRLLRAAHAEGLQIFNPEQDSQQTLTDWIS